MHSEELYDGRHNEPDGFGKLMLGGLVMAILLHGLLFFFLQSTVLDGFAPAPEPIASIPFEVKTVEIDPKMFETESSDPSGEVASKPVPDETKIEIPTEKPSFEKIATDYVATPAAPESTLPLLNERPKVVANHLNDNVNQLQIESARRVEQDLNALTQQLIQDKPQVSSRPIRDLPGVPNTRRETVGLPSNARTEIRGDSRSPNITPPGFSDLDSLLSRAGPLQSGTAPILMPTDMLFDYDQWVLRASAIESLSKLGQLIRSNPGSIFVIDGHSDSFGPDDYNLMLSKRRAESVKMWLVQTMAIDPARVITRGFGKTRLLVPPATSVEEQQLNRRVEITIRAARGG